jgi:PBP1b-binding outer membrane lipoprotein LpoB
MKSYLSLLAVSALLLTGCTSTTPESQPEYDEVDLIKYQTCLDTYLNGIMKSGTYLLANQYTEQAIDTCSALEPVKK